MAIGPGKYNKVCRKAREATQAAAIVLIVMDGKDGGGFEVQVDVNRMNGLMFNAKLPDLLENLAKLMREDFEKGKL